jgi:hypothetical protein
MRSELDAVHESVHTLIGSIETMAEELQTRRNRFGFSSMQIPAREAQTHSHRLSRTQAGNVKEPVSLLPALICRDHESLNVENDPGTSRFPRRNNPHDTNSSMESQ